MSTGSFAAVLIGSTVLLVLLIVLVLPSILRESRIASRARRDYELARGTQHLRQIKNSRDALDARLTQSRAQKARLGKQLHNTLDLRGSKLSQALCTHIVHSHLCDVRGIGPTLRDRIIAQCFDGTLTSLFRADRVYGVGDSKVWEIRSWASEWNQRLPELMQQDFPKKKSLIAEYSQKEEQIKKNLAELQDQLDSMTQLRRLAVAEEERLGRVTVEHFRDAYKQEESAAQAVDEYLQGVFTEWEAMPSWFASLISDYGG